eukprot:s177_g28.t1
MAELSEEIKDLERSAAYNILDELYRNSSISKAEMDLYKSKYAKLHEMVIQTFENEQNFVTRAKQLNQRLMQEKIKLEKTTLESQEDQNTIEQLMHQKFEIEQEYQVAQDREMMLQIQISELDHDRTEKQEQLREKEIEREKEALPKLQRAREEIELINKESEVLKTRKESYQEKLEEYNARLKEVEQEMENNRDICKVYDSELNKIKEDPERIQKQAQRGGQVPSSFISSTPAMAGNSLHVVLSSLAGDELCTVDVPGNSKASELKDFMAREVQVSPYTFKLITVGSGITVEGNGRVESLADGGRIDLTMVKIATWASCLGLFFTWQRMTKYRFLRANFIPMSGLLAPALKSDLSEGQIYVTLKEQGIMAVPKGGCVWDIGANDGVWNSNSFYLINYLNYSAVLFEPEAEVFLSLRKRYATADSPFAGRVQLYNTALLKSADVMEYRVFPASLESTLVKSRRQYDSQPDYQYHVAGADARIVCDQHKEYLKTGRCGEKSAFSVLSIDAEGSDRSIFSRIHELGCRFDLVIIEAAGEDLDGIPTPDSQGYLQLQSKGDGSPRSDSARRSRLTATVAILLFTAVVAGFFHFPYGLLVWYVVYLVEALFFNPTAKGLMRLKQTECILDYIDDIKACRPAPEIKAQCYHMETRTRHTTNQDGTTRTETYSERVDTASFTERLMVAHWDDVVDGLSFLEENRGYFPLLHVHFEIQWQAGDAETHRSHERQRQTLKNRAAAADPWEEADEETADFQHSVSPFFRVSVMRIRFPKENVYSEKYQDDMYEYRHVIMNEATAHKVWMLTDFMSRLMPEQEWRAVGVDQQTRGWIHYDAWSC